MSEELVRDFKGIWIPKNVWLNKELNTIDKIVLMEIDSLDATEEGCYASNKYLAEFCQCNEWTISTSINKLIKLDYLEVVKFDGRKRYLKSRLVKITRQTCENHKADLRKSQDINIYNNIDNNKKENIKRKSYGTYKRIKLTDKEYDKLIKDYGEDLIKKQIELLDEYVESNNNKNKYTNFNLVLRKSIRENWFNKKSHTDIYTEADVPEWFYKDLDKEEENVQEIEDILKEMESE